MSNISTYTQLLQQNVVMHELTAVTANLSCPCHVICHVSTACFLSCLTDNWSARYQQKVCYRVVHENNKNIAIIKEALAFILASGDAKRPHLFQMFVLRHSRQLHPRPLTMSCISVCVGVKAHSECAHIDARQCCIRTHRNVFRTQTACVFTSNI